MVIEMLSEKVGVSKRVLITISTLVLIGFIACGWLSYSFGQSGPTTPFVMSGGVYPGAPSFTVWGEAGTYYAKNQYGAISFASTNATVTIQNAINTLSGYGIINFKAGTYPIDGLRVIGLIGVIDNTLQHIYLKGEGQGNTILQLKAGASGAKTSYGNDATPAMIYAESPDGSGIRLTVSDLQLCGQRQSQTQNIAGIIVNDARNCYIEDTFIQNVSKWGIAYLKVNTIYRESSILRNTIYDVDDYDGTPAIPLDVNCVGIYVAQRADIYIKDNIIGWIGFNGTRADGYGINLGDSDIAVNNVIWVAGVGIQTTQDSKHSQIMSNWIDFTYDAGVYLNNATFVTVENNIIRIPYEAGILLLNSQNSLVQGNRIYNLPTYTTSYLIGESGTSDYNTIINNDLNCTGTISWIKINVIGIHTIIEGNAGYITESRGIASVANGGSIANGLDPTVPSVAVQLTCLNATYAGVPVIVSWDYGYSSVVSIAVNLYWSNGTAITTPLFVSWTARYNHA
jgi:parallel beta-helix repeat protein